jgi:DNA polymerase I
MDAESTGKNKHRDKAVGIALYTPDHKKYYIPFGHLGGGNIDQGLVRRWAQNELRDTQIVNVNTGFDVEMVNRGLDVDLERQGCTLRDVAHSAALLNEQRYGGFNLEQLGKEYVGRGKVALDIPPEDIHKVHSSLVGEYAEGDAELAYAICEAQEPKLVDEDLMEVQRLEDELIYVNNHMERNGARLDRPKLERWVKETKDKYGDLILEIWRRTGYRVNPNSSDDLEKVFRHEGLDLPVATPEGLWTKQFLLKVAKKNPVVAMTMKARQLHSLNSKYLTKYLRLIDSDNILRFSLYQLRAGDEDYGTVTGRYSSANINIQQVFKVEKQIEEFGDDDYVVRELFIPDDGMELFSGDASQIEFRLFGHYSGSRRLITAYNDHPDIDFHQLVADMLGQKRGEAKHNNFGKLYGMGRKKAARRLGLSCNCGCPDKYAWDNDRHASDCPMIKANDLMDQYDREFPEAKRLMNTAMRLAEQRGYVKTLLRRRRRYPEKEGLHSALNAVIQGSAADVFKLKLLQLYKNRHTVGIHKLRFPVHDEEVGDAIPGNREKINELFAETVIQLKVPILWDLVFGANWRECA